MMYLCNSFIKITNSSANISANFNNFANNRNNYN